MAAWLDLVAKERMADIHSGAGADRLIPRAQVEHRDPDMLLRRTNQQRRSAGPLRSARALLTAWMVRGISAPLRGAQPDESGEGWPTRDQIRSQGVLEERRSAGFGRAQRLQPVRYPSCSECSPINPRNGILHKARGRDIELSVIGMRLPAPQVHGWRPR